MPKSVSIAAFAAMIGAVFYAIYNVDAAPAPTKQQYAGVALACFNAAAIICLFVILYRTEKASNARFGAMIRDNIATVVVALIISFLGSLIDVIDAF